MLKELIRRCFVGLCFALPIGLLTVAVTGAEAQETTQEVSQDECGDCHSIIQSHWEKSAHGSTKSDPEFQSAWEGLGYPTDCLRCHTTGYDEASGTWEEDNVSCGTCHYPVSGEHPETIMPTDISSRLCGTCHLDTHSEWETSVHGEMDLTCVRCHNSHTTALKKQDVQLLCQTCHNEEAHFFSYTAHAEEGLMCADCHLKVSDGEMGEGHGRREHTFVVDIDSCTECHGENLHYPTGNEGLPDEPVEASLSMPVGRSTVSTTPEPTSPLSYAIIAALVGMGTGMVLAPWMESWYRRMQRSDES